MPATRWVLWGWTARWQGVNVPLRVCGGTKREVDARQRQFKADYPDALTGTYESGDEPTGLRLQVRQRIGSENES